LYFYQNSVATQKEYIVPFFCVFKPKIATAPVYVSKHYKAAVVTLDEGTIKSGFPRKKAQLVLGSTVSLLDPIKFFVKPITFDNEKEFTLHEKIAEALNCDSYFAKPYSSWEKKEGEAKREC